MGLWLQWSWYMFCNTDMKILTESESVAEIDTAENY